MRIALAADHAGYPLKDELAGWLREQGHDVSDLGTNGPKASIIPNSAASSRTPWHRPGGARNRDLRLGIGISIAVNREPRCRCARVSEPLSASSPASIMMQTCSRSAPG